MTLYEPTYLHLTTRDGYAALICLHTGYTENDSVIICRDTNHRDQIVSTWNTLASYPGVTVITYEG